METPFEKPPIEQSKTDPTPKIKLATSILPLKENVIPFEAEDPEVKTRGEKERFLKLSEGARVVGNNRKRFWNMLVSTVERAGYKPPQDRQTVVLDLACGRCEEGIILSAFFGGETFGWRSNNVKLIGVDISEKDIQKAISDYSSPDFSEKVTKYVLPPNYEFVVGDAINLNQYPQIPKEADVVMIRHEQISDNKHDVWTKIFQQALLKLNEGGIIITTSFSDLEHKMLIAALRKLDCEIVINESNPYAKPLGHKEISLDRNIAIVRKKKLSSTEIGSEITRHNESVKDTVSEWKLLLDTLQNSGNSRFFMFWIAGPDEKTKPAIDYIAKQLGIDSNAVIEFEIDPNQRDLTGALEQSVDKIKSVDGNRVLVIARGWEKVLANTTESYKLSRAGHDWDQDTRPRTGTPLDKLYSETNKQVIIITTIGFSEGQETYSNAVKSAIASQHGTGIMLFK